MLKHCICPNNFLFLKNCTKYGVEVDVLGAILCKYKIPAFPLQSFVKLSVQN
jgi:hypothetical protein